MPDDVNEIGADERVVEIEMERLTNPRITEWPHAGNC